MISLENQSIETSYPNRVLLVEDTIHRRSTVRKLLKAAAKGVHIDNAVDETTAFGYLKKFDYRYIAIDIHDSRQEEKTLVAKIVRQYPGIKIILFVECFSTVVIRRFLGLGVHVFLNKNGDELVEAVKAIKVAEKGQKYISKALLARLIGGKHRHN